MRSNLERIFAAPAAAGEAKRLFDKAKRAAEFLKLLSLRRPTVSQQLARLRAEGLAATRRDRKTIFYSFASEEARVVVGGAEMFCGRK